MRHLRYAHPATLPLEPCVLVLIESDSTEVVTYLSPQPFLRIQRDARWFRFNGIDRGTGEYVFLPETV